MELETKKSTMTTSLDGVVERFNSEYAVGDRVLVIDGEGRPFEDVIREPASVMGGHTPLAWLVGKGCYALDRVKCKVDELEALNKEV